MEHIETLLRDILSEVKALREQGQQPAQPRPFLPIDEVASMLGLSVKTIRNQMSAKRFPLKPTRIGGRVLFRAADLEHLAKN